MIGPEGAQREVAKKKPHLVWSMLVLASGFVFFLLHSVTSYSRPYFLLWSRALQSRLEKTCFVRVSICPCGPQIY